MIKYYKKIMEIGQLSVQLLAPLALCIGVALFIQKKWNNSPWIMLLAILIGVSVMILTIYKLIKRKLNMIKNTDISSFNSHS